MKKIDFHIHTIPTVWDTHFDFNLAVLERYVEDSALDAIAITNHNIFDPVQFSSIVAAVDALVFPGIEVSLDAGHVLVIADAGRLDTFEQQTRRVAGLLNSPRDTISVEQMLEIFDNLEEYLVIPHYDKRPAVKGRALETLRKYIEGGEVDSPKKFVRLIKSQDELTPVIFGDSRICDALDPLPTRQTFVDCGEISLGALKVCMRDKSKVALSKEHGNSLFQIFENGQNLSSGLNILLGERSSGKSYTLDRIAESTESIKYIRQFSLVQQDDAVYEREFSKDLQRTRSQFIENYLSGFRDVVDDIIEVNWRSDEREVDKYIESLKSSAEEAHRRDAFSNSALFDAAEYSIGDDKMLTELIESVRQIIENVEFKDVIEKHVDLKHLKNLAVELIEILRRKKIEVKKKVLINGIVREVKEGLKRRTSAIQVDDVDFYRVALNRRKVARFSEIAKGLQATTTISEESIQGFKIVATKRPFGGAGEIKDASGVKTAFKEAFDKYNRPYSYLRQLLDKEDLARSDLYKLFVKIGYKIINRDGFEVSGGERSEFRLLQEIRDAQNYDMLLIDEPESSFDNLFLRSDVNQIIKEISEIMPVVVVTHNNTVGASVGADYILYAKKSIEGGDVVYRIYSGHPTDRDLRCTDGASISNHEIIMKSLEAGKESYEERKRRYEGIENC